MYYKKKLYFGQQKARYKKRLYRFGKQEVEYYRYKKHSIRIYFLKLAACK